MSTIVEATIEDLYKVEGKAELVGGEIVPMSPTGDEPGYASDEVFGNLREHAKQTGTGRAVADGKGFLANLPHRKSFVLTPLSTPDAAAA